MGPQSMSLDPLKKTPMDTPTVVIPANCILDVIQQHYPVYYQALLKSGLAKRYISGQYTVFVPSVQSVNLNSRIKYMAWINGTTVPGAIEPEALSTGLLLDTLNPIHKYIIGNPHYPIIIRCTNGWVYGGTP